MEAYLYFDFAWLISKDGLIHAFDIDEYCSKRLNGSGSAASKLFANNQRLTLGKPDPEVDRLLETQTSIDISETDLERFSYTFKSLVDFKSVLDLRFYYGRAFYSTEKSIQQFTAQGRDDLESNGIGRTVKQPLHERHVSDSACRQFQCRYGAVSAACGREGGLIGLGASSDESNWEIDFRKFAPQSYGIELNPDAISNLRTPTQVEFYHAQSRATAGVSDRLQSEEGRPDKLELTTVDGPSYEQQTKLIADLVKQVDQAPKRFFLFKSTLWIEFENGTMRRVLATEADKLSNNPTITPSFAAPSRVLATSLTSIGVIAEGDDQVFLRQKNRWHVLVDDQVHSVRGYMNSRRYRHVVTAVRRDQVELISLLN
ncbi:hypothetical protein [Sphingomonas morindae]|uniref:Uncharacterized protein n=1 Tax=Sphingomonas morindae TaxID=1541170 RepID=A0ABY4X7I9_9SPHN|nr:hypothetical protein [Sphingomonas morindae]USI72897.1 hypothetical protein LHA26_16785 [Sphingomonas morindae]